MNLVPAEFHELQTGTLIFLPNQSEYAYKITRVTKDSAYFMDESGRKYDFPFTKRTDFEDCLMSEDECEIPL